MTQQHQVPIFAPSPVAVLPPLREPARADEANPRIANNLQLLSALISLDARRVSNPEMRDWFATVQRRIGAIANVHRQLYIAPDKAFVDLGAYLCELAEELDAAAAAIEGGMVRGQPSRGTGVGSQLVAIMAQRLRAAHRWHDNAPGTRFTLCVEPR